FKILYATSADGLSWVSIGPVFESELYVTDPTVIKDTTGYTMWYADSNAGYIEIYRAISTDGITWQRNPETPVISKGTGSDFDRASASAPFVLKDGSVYKMWYSGHDTSAWRVGYATSPDGISWTKYAQNPVLQYADSPDVQKTDSGYDMYFHQTGPCSSNQIYKLSSTDGINWGDENSKETIICPTNWYESRALAPSVISVNGQTRLYYTGIGNDGNWRILLATFGSQQVSRTPTVLIPGFLGSWNKEALLHKQTVNWDTWILSPFAHEYDGIIQTLKNIGYVENTDLYIFPYDWRKNVDDAANDLKSFIDTKVVPNHASEQVNIIGHSYGGLVGRIYTQKYNPPFINKVVTVGSPHSGVAQAYKAVEAGEIETEDSLLWLAQKLVLQLFRDGAKTDRQVMNEQFPSIKDALPLYNYLENLVNPSIQNTRLSTYQSILSTVLPKLITVSGTGFQTLYQYKVGLRSKLDQLLDLYPDGRPTQTYTTDGDSLVIKSSAIRGDNSYSLSSDHGELIYSSVGIQKILEVLNISYQQNQISIGNKTIIKPSLIFLVFSPATLEVQYGNTTYPEQEGMVLVENAISGNYMVRAKGTAQGRYTILVGSLGTQVDTWKKIEGEITNSNPSQEVDEYTVSFSNSSPDKHPIDNQNLPSLIMNVITVINDINVILNNSSLSKAKTNLELASTYLQQGKKGFAKSALENAQTQLLTALFVMPDTYREQVITIL
ncbi:MAG: alpha/beta fold hydrolase, partial [Patescibacteria group bacterium]